MEKNQIFFQISYPLLGQFYPQKRGQGHQLLQSSTSRRHFKHVFWAFFSKILFFGLKANQFGPKDQSELSMRPMTKIWDERQTYFGHKMALNPSGGQTPIKNTEFCIKS